MEHHTRRNTGTERHLVRPREIRLQPGYRNSDRENRDPRPIDVWSHTQQRHAGSGEGSRKPGGRHGRLHRADIPRPGQRYPRMEIPRDARDCYPQRGRL